MELKYTQEDLDNIVSKAKENMKTKYERDFVSKNDYDLLKTEHSTLLSGNQKDKIKTEFLKRNGNEDAFEDFYNVVKENLNELDEKGMEKQFNQLKQDKQWAFSPEGNTQTNTNDPILNQMFNANGGNEDLVEGTIYKKIQ